MEKNIGLEAIDELENCCEIASSALDGKYGWGDETVALIVFIIIFNIFAKWLLSYLHRRFEAQHKIWKDSFVQALYAPLSLYTWIFAIVHATNLIFPKISSEGFLSNMHLGLEMAGVLALAWFLLRWKKILIRLLKAKSLRHEIAVQQGKIDVIDKALTVLVIVISSMLLLEISGRSLSTLIAFGGIGGLAIAFASQEVIANFFSGLMIYLTHPFGVGDWINLPERNIEGNVEEIGWYTTRVRTFEKRPIYVPNSIFSKVVVETPSRMSHRQLKETVHLRYRDTKVVQKIINDIAAMLEAHPNVDQDQKIGVNLDGFGVYSLDISISAYTTVVESEEFATVKQEILFYIIDIISMHGAEMASPTTIVEIPNGLVVKSDSAI